MTVQELIGHLKKYPKNAEVWVSDAGYLEGATPAVSPIFQCPWSGPVRLDGDEVVSEYFIEPEDTEKQHLIESGYSIVDHDPEVWARNVVMIRSKNDEH